MHQIGAHSCVRAPQMCPMVGGQVFALEKAYRPADLRPANIYRKFLIDTYKPRFSIRPLSRRIKWLKMSGQIELFCGIPQTLHPCALLHRDSEV